jgi:hypothetical protein
MRILPSFASLLLIFGLATALAGCSCDDDDDTVPDSGTDAPLATVDGAPDGTPAPDAPAASACDACTPGQRCVHLHDGVCHATVQCVDTELDCPTGTCTPECDEALCGPSYQCDDSPPCGDEIPGAFQCYGA